MVITLRKIVFLKLYCLRTLSEAKGNFVPKGFLIGYGMAEKNAKMQTDRQTDTHTFSYLYK